MVSMSSSSRDFLLVSGRFFLRYDPNLMELLLEGTSGLWADDAIPALHWRLIRPGEIECTFQLENLCL